MSSYSEGIASVAPILIMPFAAIGLLAWTGGEAIYNLNRMLDDRIETVKQQAAELNQQRREEALELREKLMSRLRGMFSEIEALCLRAGPEAAVELSGLKAELIELLNSSCPEQTEELQAQNSAVYLSIEKILRRQKVLKEGLDTKGDSYTDIICMSRLMDELRSYFAYCSFSATTVDMLNDLKSISQLASILSDGSSVLQAALGDDYATINSNMKQIIAELENIERNLDTVIKDMESYISMVKTIRITVN